MECRVEVVRAVRNLPAYSCQAGIGATPAVAAITAIAESAPRPKTLTVFHSVREISEAGTARVGSTVTSLIAVLPAIGAIGGLLGAAGLSRQDAQAAGSQLPGRALLDRAQCRQGEGAARGVAEAQQPAVPSGGSWKTLSQGPHREPSAGIHGPKR